MNRAEIIEFNRELLQKMKKAGIKLEDYKYCDLYRDYVAMSHIEPRRKVIILTLAQKYNITDRQVYNGVRHMEQPVT